MRPLALAAIALGALWAGQASAFWPFGGVTRLVAAPAYGGVCEHCDLSGRILAGAKMSNSVFNHSDFSHAVLARADASNSTFAEADFTGADLSRARLVAAQCPGAIFARARLARANARGADFTHADFDGADLSGADLRDARGLTQAQLDGACGDAQTRLPPGLSVRACG